MQKFSSASSFQVLCFHFQSCSLHTLILALFPSQAESTALHWEGKFGTEMHCLVRWLGNENFKCTAMVRNMWICSGCARTICQVLCAFGSFWALNHSYLAHQKYCDNRPSSKIILFVCVCSDTSYRSC